MSTETTLLREILVKSGGNIKPPSDDLLSTRYSDIIKACGGSVDDLPDRLPGTFLKRIAEVVGNGIVTVDELPTEDIKTGTAYICNGEIYFYKESGNTWVFNDVLTMCHGLDDDFSFRFTNDGEGINGTRIYFNSYGGSAAQHIVFATDQFEPWGSPKNIGVYAYDESYSGTAGWQKEEYKTITILEMPTDEVALAWLNENATPASGWVKYAEVGGKIYISENGTYDVTNYREATVSVIVPKVVEVDELPTEDINLDDVYVYNDDLYRGNKYVTYELNDVLQQIISDYGSHEWWNNFDLYPIQPDAFFNFDFIVLIKDSTQNVMGYRYPVDKGDGTFDYETLVVYDFNTNTWVDPKYKTIVFNGTVEDYMEEDLLTWLKANGTRKYFSRYTLTTEGGV